MPLPEREKTSGLEVLKAEYQKLKEEFDEKKITLAEAIKKLEERGEKPPADLEFGFNKVVTKTTAAYEYALGRNRHIIKELAKAIGKLNKLLEKKKEEEKETIPPAESVTEKKKAEKIEEEKKEKIALIEKLKGREENAISYLTAGLLSFSGQEKKERLKKYLKISIDESEDKKDIKMKETYQALLNKFENTYRVIIGRTKLFEDGQQAIRANTVDKPDSHRRGEEYQEGEEGVNVVVLGVVFDNQQKTWLILTKGLLQGPNDQYGRKNIKVAFDFSIFSLKDLEKLTKPGQIIKVNLGKIVHTPKENEYFEAKLADDFFVEATSPPTEAPPVPALEDEELLKGELSQLPELVKGISDTEEQKRKIADALHQARRSQGYQIADFEKIADPEEKRQAYEKWDWEQAEKILDKYLKREKKPTAEEEAAKRKEEEEKKEAEKKEAEKKAPEKELKDKLDKVKITFAAKEVEWKKYQGLRGLFKFGKKEEKANIEKEYEEIKDKYLHAKAEYIALKTNNFLEDKSKLIDGYFKVLAKKYEKKWGWELREIISKGYDWYKKLGDINLANTEWFKKKMAQNKGGKVSKFLLNFGGRFVSARSALSYGLLGAGVLAGGGWILASTWVGRRALAAFGGGFGTYDILKIHQKAELEKETPPEKLAKMSEKEIVERMRAIETFNLMEGKDIGGPGYDYLFAELEQRVNKKPAEAKEAKNEEAEKKAEAIKNKLAELSEKAGEQLDKALAKHVSADWRHKFEAFGVAAVLGSGLFGEVIGRTWRGLFGAESTMNEPIESLTKKSGKAMAVFQQKIEHLSELTKDAQAKSADMLNAMQEFQNKSLVALREGLEKIHLTEISTLHKGEGIIHVLRRQLEDNPARFGCPEDIQKQGAQAIHQWATHQAGQISIKEGYWQPGQGTQKWFIYDPKKPTHFFLEGDAEKGLGVQEVGSAKSFTHFEKKLEWPEEWRIGGKGTSPEYWRQHLEKFLIKHPEYGTGEWKMPLKGASLADVQQAYEGIYQNVEKNNLPWPGELLGKRPAVMGAALVSSEVTIKPQISDVYGDEDLEKIDIYNQQLTQKLRAVGNLVDKYEGFSAGQTDQSILEAAQAVKKDILQETADWKNTVTSGKKLSTFFDSHTGEKIFDPASIPPQYRENYQDYWQKWYSRNLDNKIWEQAVQGKAGAAIEGLSSVRVGEATVNFLKQAGQMQPVPRGLDALELKYAADLKAAGWFNQSWFNQGFDPASDSHIKNIGLWKDAAAGRLPRLEVFTKALEKLPPGSPQAKLLQQAIELEIKDTAKLVNLPPEKVFNPDLVKKFLPEK